MSSSETFEFFDERVALLFVGFTVWNTNGDCAAVIEPVYRDNCIRLPGIFKFMDSFLNKIERITSVLEPLLNRLQVLFPICC